jgi:hypothetical protein
MFVVVILAIIVLTCVVLYHIGRRPYKNSRLVEDSFEEFFQILLEDKVEGAQLLIEVPQVGGFIQFVKYDARSFGCGFPDAEWSRGYFEKATECAQAMRLDYSVQPTGRNDVTRFLDVNFSGDVKAADTFCHRILDEVFEVPPNSKLLLSFTGAGVSLPK